MTFAQPGVSARHRSTSGSITNPHVASFAAPNHCADPPLSVALEELNAVHAAVQQFAIASSARLVRTQHVSHVSELPGLPPQLAFPETRHLAGVDHRFEIN